MARPPTQVAPRSAGCVGIAWALAAWVFIGLTAFVAIGDPEPGVGFDAAVEWKHIMAGIFATVSLVAAAQAVLLGLRGRREGRAAAVAALVLGVPAFGLNLYVLVAGLLGRIGL